MKMISLDGDFELGEGDLKITEAFRKTGALLRADMIKDWMYDLERLYKEALADMHEHGAESTIEER